jgi:tellurite resistance protein
MVFGRAPAEVSSGTMKIETLTITRLRDALLQSGRRPSMLVSSAYETLTREGLLSLEEVAALNRVDPLAETMFLMMAADGTLADAERDAVRGAIRGLTDNVLRSGTIKVMMETYQARLEQEGREERLRQIADEIAAEPQEAEGAFALAAAVALADDDVSEEENAFINQLAEWFGISDERAGQILDQLQDDRTEEGEST